MLEKESPSLAPFCRISSQVSEMLISEQEAEMWEHEHRFFLCFVVVVVSV